MLFVPLLPMSPGERLIDRVAFWRFVVTSSGVIFLGLMADTSAELLMQQGSSPRLMPKSPGALLTVRVRFMQVLPKTSNAQALGRVFG